MGRRMLLRLGHALPKTGQGLRALRLKLRRLSHRRVRLFHALRSVEIQDSNERVVVIQAPKGVCDRADVFDE